LSTFVPNDLLHLVETATGPFHYAGDTVLVFRDHAQAVRLQTWMPSFPDQPAFTSLASNLHFLRLPLPASARIEYRLEVHAGRRPVIIEDPLNPPSASNPFGVNSVVTGPDYERPWFESGVVAGSGSATEIRVNSLSLGGRRHHQVYLPYGVTRKDARTLLLVHDGSDFLEHGGLGRALDSLTDRQVIPPLAAILLDPRDRITEYGASVAHSRHVALEVLPHVARRLRIWAPGQRTVALGSSLGGVASVAVAAHHPGSVGAVVSLSGSFAHRTDYIWPESVFAPVISFLESFDPTLLAGFRMYQSVGRYEGLVDFNRRLHPILRAGGMNVRYVETWAGHDWASWRDRLEEALTFVLPSPMDSDRPS
jgi:enterochelin esterase family protein